jgi:hypothetical protein
MDELRYYHRPWFYLIFPPILVVILYFFTAPRGVDNNVYIWGIIEDLAIYFGLLTVWLVFFAQFVLPVQTFKDRQKIFDRLLVYLAGKHGPAIFVRDGQPVKSEGEERKKGPGVLWLDSASGVVTRTDATFKSTLGPGVHFTEKGETIAGYVDLHIQNHSIGPRDNEDPFAKKLGSQSNEEYKFIQDHRFQTSALTRDGIEVIPSISVTFKIDADPISDSNLPGSRFGFNADAVLLAVRGEAIDPNPDIPKASHGNHVPWNQLPALLAADVWRDLVSQFTLNDLFEQKYSLPSAFPNVTRQEIIDDPLLNPIKPQGEFEEFLTNIVKELNRSISQWANWIEDRCNPSEKIEPKKPLVGSKNIIPKEGKVTGLQLINFLIRERLQKQNTAALDRYGNYQSGQPSLSNEHAFLRKRGIYVHSASISKLRLPREIDEKLISQWTANWLGHARVEQDRLNQEEGFNRIQIEETALQEYIVQLSSDLLTQVRNNRATDLRETLRALLLESRVALVRETQVFRQTSSEREALEEIIQWLEARDS